MTLFIKMDGERFPINTKPWTVFVRDGDEFNRCDVHTHQFQQVLDLVRRHAPELHDELADVADYLTEVFEEIGRTGRILYLTHDDGSWSLTEHGTVLGAFTSLDECVIHASALV